MSNPKAVAALRTEAGRRVYAELGDEAWLGDLLAIEAEAADGRLRAALENLVAEAKSPKVVPTLELLAALQDATRALRPAALRRQQ